MFYSFKSHFLQQTKRIHQTLNSLFKTHFTSILHNANNCIPNFNMISQVFTRFVIAFTFVLCLTAATPCVVRQHQHDNIKINEDNAKIVKRQVVEAKVEDSELLPQEPMQEATLHITEGAEKLPENNVINKEEESNDSLGLSEGEDAGNGEIKEIKEIVPEMQRPEQQPKSEIDDDVRPIPINRHPIPINHRNSPDTTFLGKIQIMMSKVKDWIVGS